MIRVAAERRQQETQSSVFLGFVWSLLPQSYVHLEVRTINVASLRGGSLLGKNLNKSKAAAPCRCNLRFCCCGKIHKQKKTPTTTKINTASKAYWHAVARRGNTWLLQSNLPDWEQKKQRASRWWWRKRGAYLLRNTQECKEREDIGKKHVNALLTTFHKHKNPLTGALVSSVVSLCYTALTQTASEVLWSLGWNQNSAQCYSAHSNWNESKATYRLHWRAVNTGLTLAPPVWEVETHLCLQLYLLQSQ